jgi:N6-adenosine-specific RNA methylase IME4
MKPSCQRCGKKAVVHYIRSNKRWIAIGYYCSRCDLIVKPIHSDPPVVHRMDVREYLNNITTEKFDLILCDPPYFYDVEANRASDRIGNHYSQMATQEICELPIQNITEKKAILFLWSPSPKIEDAMEIIKSWRFEYKTQIVWNKKYIGLGRNVRQMHEILLIAKKGDYPVPLFKPQSIIEEKRTDHSRKPEKSYEIINRMYPDSRKIELFARYVYPGWIGVGLEAEPKTYTDSRVKVYTKLNRQKY